MTTRYLALTVAALLAVVTAGAWPHLCAVERVAAEAFLVWLVSAAAVAIATYWRSPARRRR